MNLNNLIRQIPNWPSPGVTFKDISPLLLNPEGFNLVIETFAKRYENYPLTKILGIDSRGFLFSAPLAYRLKKPLVMARKKGKLPPPTYSESYALEYGEASLEVGKNTLNPSDKVLIIDDILATGGTIEAAKALLKTSGAKIVEAGFLLDIRSEISSNYTPSFPIFSVLS